MKVVVTGGCGFIGSHLAYRLVRAGHTVIAIDDCSTGRLENSRALDGVEIVRGDIMDSALLDQTLSGAEAVFHVAALPSVPRSWSDPLSSLRVNAMGTACVARASVRQGVNSLIYSSSSSVYGNQPADCRSEDMETGPISPYGYSKLLGEEVVLAHGRAGDLRALALRYFNVFGPRQDPDSPYSAVIPKFIRMALLGEPVVVHGDGSQSRDFTYVDNVVDANLLALASSTGGLCLNVACGRSVSLLQLVAAISGLSTRPLKMSHAEPRHGDVLHSRADCRLAERVLGYRPRVQFEAGLSLTYDHYSDN